MSTSEMEITGDLRHSILTTTRSSSQVQRLIRKFEEQYGYTVSQEVVTTVPEEEEKYIASLVFETERETELAEINVIIHKDQVINALATIDQYEESSLITVKLYYITDGAIVTDTVRTSTASSRSSGGIACDLCKVLYSKGKSIIQAGVRSNLTAGYLCTQSNAKIVNKLNKSAAQQCMNISPDVVDYINNHGVSSGRSTACQNMNYCP